MQSQLQGLSSLLADSKLMHLYDQAVIEARRIDDQVQLPGSTNLRGSAHGAASDELDNKKPPPKQGPCDVSSRDHLA